MTETESDVWIKVRGMQFSPDTTDPEETEIIISGRYYKKNGKRYLRYEEILPDESGVTKNTVKISSDAVDILKDGPVNTHMLFQKNQKTNSYYYTPFGNLLIGLNTEHINILETDTSLLVEVRYGLELNNHHLADCKVSISADAKEAGFSL